MKLTEMSAEELASFKAEVQKEYDDFKAQGLSLRTAQIAETTAVLTVCLRLRHFLLLCSA